MLGMLENIAMTWLVNGLVGGVFSLVKGALAFTWAHPLLAGYVFFSLFVLCFLSYGTLRRMWDDGTWTTLHISHKILLLVFLIVPFIFAYIFDIFVMRVCYGWIRFGYKPWQQDWRFWSASWTFSRLVWVLKDISAEAQWWHQILHAIDPRGH